MDEESSKPTTQGPFSFEKNFSIQLIPQVKSNGSIRLFQNDTHVMCTLFGPKENVIYSAPDRKNLRIEVKIMTRLHLSTNKAYGLEHEI